MRMNYKRVFKKRSWGLYRKSALVCVMRSTAYGGHKLTSCYHNINLYPPNSLIPDKIFYKYPLAIKLN